ncbi:hypothetical protein DOK67_0002457 [Enterococcus sp. DIV0212c]|uniref:HD domain-containing protein n=1 Tax=Enterococcus sp. DIV0212c TaxID=2230867 RepID=UPI001A9B1FAF|nr:HD domain-containing protein [Enterococcus sp. DIV0212c]MBO1352483.1 HD domain-containing protein [Enterococcus sp. DIV0212c]
MSNQQIEAIKTYAQSIATKDKSGHGMDHINRVVRMANKIAETETCDRFIITAAAYLHDTVDDKLVSEPELAYKQLIKLLEDLNVSNTQIQEILHIIRNLSFSQELEGNAEKLTIEGQIVQDADRLDAMGAIGIIRTIYYGGHKGNRIYDPEIPPRTLHSKAEYRNESTVINHFYEKILLLNNSLNTRYAKEIGDQRQKFLELFLEEFLEEWE